MAKTPQAVSSGKSTTQVNRIRGVVDTVSYYLDSSSGNPRLRVKLNFEGSIRSQDYGYFALKFDRITDPRLFALFNDRNTIIGLQNGTIQWLNFDRKVVLEVTLASPKNSFSTKRENPEPTISWSVLEAERIVSKPQSTHSFEEPGDPGFRPLRVPFTPFFLEDGELLEREQTRMGYAIFDNPIAHVSYSRNSQIDQVPMLREAGTMKKGTGRAYESYSISYFAHGPEEIRKSVADVFEQISLNPFITVEGGPFGSGLAAGDIPHRSIAVRNFSVATVDGFPNTLQVNIDFDPFIWEWYVPPGEVAPDKGTPKYYSSVKVDEFYHNVSSSNPRIQMDDFICWPLVKLWCKTRAKSKFNDRQFSGLFELSFPSEDSAALISTLLGTRVAANPNNTDLNTLEAFKAIKNESLPPSATRNIKEISVKEILGYQDSRYFVLKLESPELLKEIYGAIYSKGNTPNAGSSEGYVVGLTDWSRLASYNFVDGDGSFLPQSNIIDSKFFSRMFPNGLGEGPETSDPVNGIVDISASDIGTYGAEIAIERQTLNKYFGSATVPTTGSSNYVTYIRKVNPEIKAKQATPEKFYALVLRYSAANGGQALNTKIEQLLNKAKEMVVSGKEDRIYRDINQVIVDSYSPGISYNIALTDSQDIIIESIAGNRGHNLALINTQAFPEPIHQYLGGIDATFIIQGKVFGAEARQLLMSIKEEFDLRALSKSSRRYVTEGQASRDSTYLNGAFMRVKNEIFQLLGVDFVLPMTVTFDSVEGQPDVWTFQITFIEFNPRQKYIEEVRYMPTSISSLGLLYQYGNDYFGGFSGFDPLADRGREWFSLQASLAQEEVYPDMALPTKQELSTWLAAIKKAAKIYDPKQNQKYLLPDADLKNSDYVFTNLDRSIVEIVSEYIPEYYQFIRNWPARTEPKKNEGTLEEQTAYEDPDFFCYYVKDLDFKTNFDLIGNYIFGKAGPNYTNNINPERGLTNPEFYREVDTHHGVVSVAGTGVFRAGATQTNQFLEQLYENTFPKEKAEQIKQAYDSGQERLINEAGARWWVKDKNFTTNTFTQKDQQIRTSPGFDEQAYSGSLPGGGGATVEAEEYGTGFLGMFDNPTLSESELDIGDNWLKYFTVPWRQSITIKAAGLYTGGGRIPFPGKSMNFALKSPVTLFKELSNSSSIRLNDGNASINIEDFDSSIIDTKYTVENFILASLLYLNRTRTGARGSRPANNNYAYDSIIDELSYMSSGVRDWMDENSFLVRSAILNHNFRNTNSSEAPPKLVGTAAQRLEDSWAFFDGLAKTYQIDPNILRTVFFMRDGFGAYNPQASQERSFADFDGDAFISLGINPENRHWWIMADKIAERYSEYYKRYAKSPTLALLALGIEFGSNARRIFFDQKTRDLSKDVAEDFERVASFLLKNGKFNKTSADQVTALITKYSASGVFIDAYYASYIQLCRVYGSYHTDYLKNIGMYDSFFYPLNPLVMIGEEGAFINTTFFPSQRSGLIHGGRGEIKDYLPGEEAYFNGAHNVPGGGDGIDANALSLELRIKREQKFKIALEPGSEASVYGSLIGMRDYSPFGRLLGAFPAYKIIITNEGFYWAQGSTKLWDNFYTRTGVGSIEIFKSRHLAGSTCEIVLSNMFHNITAYSQMEAFEHQLAVESNRRFYERMFGSAQPDEFDPVRFTTFPFRTIGMLWEDLVIKKVPDQVRTRWQNNHLKQLVLSTGARIQVRMGYGSHASKLPVVFNGMVVDAPVSEGYVKLTCVGDGVELEKPSNNKLIKTGNAFAYADGAAWGAGRDPSVIVTEAIVAPKLTANLSQGLFRDFSHGIAHFGDLHFQGFLHTSAELQANIYTSSPTKIEQGIPSFDYFNFFMGLTTWNNEKNLISIEVQEPTAWKVIEVCRRAVTDFVASAEPFCTRSSLFFGKPWYPFHYDYAASILDQSSLTNIQGTGRIDRAVEQGVNSQPVPGSTTPKSSTQKASPQALTIPPEIQEKVTKLKERLQRDPDMQKAYKAGQKPGKIIINMHLEKVYSNNTQEAFSQAFQDAGIQIEQGGTPQDSEALEERRRRMLAPQRRLPESTKTWRIEYYDLPKGYSQRTTNHIPNDAQVTIADGGSFNYAGYNQDRYRLYSSTRNYGLNNSLADVTVYTSHLKWRNYCQFYIADSFLNLLANDIRADSTNVYTDAIGQHTFGGFGTRDSATRTIVFSADTDIQPADRKTMLVETGLSVTGTQAGWLGLARGVTDKMSHIPVIGSFVGASSNKYISETPSTPAITNSVHSALCDSLKEMYQGWFTITGNAMIKPRDFFAFSDHIMDLKGPLLVKEVVHRLDAQSGFITMISPDALVLPANSFIGQRWYLGLYQFGSRLSSHLALRVAGGAILNLIKTIPFRMDGEITSKAAKTYRLMKELDSDLEQDFQAALKHYARDGGPLDETFRKSKEKYLFQINEIQRNSNLTTAQQTERITKIQKEIEKLDEELTALKKTIMNENILDLNGLRRQLGPYNINLNKVFDEFTGTARPRLEGEIVAKMKLKSNLDSILAERKAFVTEKLKSNILFSALKTDEAIAGADRIIMQQLSDLFDDPDLVPYLKARGLDQDNYNVLFSYLRNNSIEGLDFSELEEAMRGSRRSFNPKRIKERRAALKAIRIRNAATIAEASKTPSDILRNNLDDLGIKFRRIKTLSKQLKEAQTAGDIEAIRSIQASIRLFTRSNADAAFKSILRNGKAGVQAFRLAKYAGPQILVTAALEVMWFTIGNAILQGFNARLAARQSVKIIPLRAGKLPYTAGIKGHQGAVIGDSPGYLDTLLENTLGTSGSFGLLSSFIGIEVPKYGTTDVDQQWIDLFRQENAEIISELEGDSNEI